MLPIDLVLVRHGQSEGNVAKRLFEGGDSSGYSTLQGRHTARYRLSELGRQQPAVIGRWLQQEFYHRKSAEGPDIGFDRHFTSDYVRALETAWRLDLPNAEWHRDSYLTERDWGDLDSSPEDVRQEKFKAALEQRDVEPFFWRPNNGERYVELNMRVDRVLNTFHRECSDQRVCVVCHGEVMWSFRIRIERMSQERFRELHLSKNPADRIHNCEVLHYTRRNPVSGKLDRHANWMRRIRPFEDAWTTGWQEIVRPRYTNEDLRRIVEETPVLLS